MIDPCNICGERVKLMQLNAKHARPRYIKDVWEFVVLLDKSEIL